MEKKRILVTGAAGFIGFHFMKQASMHGHFVVGLDNFNNYYDVQLKKDRSDVLKKMGLSVHVQDVTDSKALTTLMEQERITHVVHLAAQAGVRHSLAHPEKYIKSNIDGFLSLLEALRLRPHTRLVYASSSSVYGNNRKIPFSETDVTDSQANLYGVTKKSNELMANCYHSLFQIPVTGLRFFTVYGPWGRPDMAYYSFTQAIMEGKTIGVYHEGKCRRDFTYIDDIIGGIMNALSVKESSAIFNLGNNKPESVMRLIELIEEETGKKANIRLLPQQLGDIEETYADIETARKELQFVPKVSLREGMKHFVSWYRSYLKI